MSKLERILKEKNITKNTKIKTTETLTYVKLCYMNMGPETLLFSNISKHASHFKMDSNTLSHLYTHTQTHIVYYY